MSLPDGFTIRAATEADLDEVVALIRASADAGLATSPTYAANLLRHWRDPYRIDGDYDPLVVGPDGRIVGYLDMFMFEPFTVFEFEAYVHPDFAETPVFRAMLELAEARAREAMVRAPEGEPVYLDGQSNGNAMVLRRSYEAAGFPAVRAFLTMLAEMDEPPPPPVWPTGVSVRRFVPGQDEREVWKVSEIAWVDHWRHQPMAFEEFVYLRITAQPNHDPSLWFVAVEHGAIVGVLIGSPVRASVPDSGWISLVAVLREHRGRGIGLTLLREACAEFYRRGYRKVALSVDAESDTGANRLYERAGMREIKRTVVFEKVLRD